MIIWNRIKKDIKKYGIGILAVVILYFTMHFFLNGFCISVVATGFPCPGCGLTRSILFLARGEVIRSFNIHPMGVFVVAFSLYGATMRYILGKPIYGWKWIASILAVMGVGLFLIRMIEFFPDRPPYTYTKGNIMEKILPFYKEFVENLLFKIKEY